MYMLRRLGGQEINHQIHIYYFFWGVGGWGGVAVLSHAYRFTSIW